MRRSQRAGWATGLLSANSHVQTMYLALAGIGLATHRHESQSHYVFATMASYAVLLGACLVTRRLDLGRAAAPLVACSALATASVLVWPGLVTFTLASGSAGLVQLLNSTVSQAAGRQLATNQRGRYNGMRQLTSQLVLVSLALVLFWLLHERANVPSGRPAWFWIVVAMTGLLALSAVTLALWSPEGKHVPGAPLGTLMRDPHFRRWIAGFTLVTAAYSIVGPVLPSYLGPLLLWTAPLLDAGARIVTLPLVWWSGRLVDHGFAKVTATITSAIAAVAAGVLVFGDSLRGVLASDGLIPAAVVAIGAIGGYLVFTTTARGELVRSLDGNSSAVAMALASAAAGLGGRGVSAGLLPDTGILRGPQLSLVAAALVASLVGAAVWVASRRWDTDPKPVITGTGAIRLAVVETYENGLILELPDVSPPCAVWLPWGSALRFWSDRAHRLPSIQTHLPFRRRRIIGGRHRKPRPLRRPMLPRRDGRCVARARKPMGTAPAWNEWRDGRWHLVIPYDGVWHAAPHSWQ